MSRRIIAVLVALVGAGAVLVPVSAQAATVGTYGIGIELDTASDQAPFLGDVITVKGRVTGGPVKGRSVTLYARNSPSWKRIGTAALTSRGTYSRAVRLRDGGYHRFRAVISSSREWRGRSISSGLLPVYRVVDGAEVTDTPSTSVRVDGETYEDSWSLANAESVTFALAGKQCYYADMGLGAVDRADATPDTDFGTAVVTSPGGRIGRVQPDRDALPVGFYTYFRESADVTVTAQLDAGGQDRLAVVDPYFYCNVRR